MKKYIFFFTLVLIALCSVAIPFFVSAQTTISLTVPGLYNINTQGPGAAIANIYYFALAVGGILAFGVIVYGGVRYMISSGNPSGQSDAKEWIEAALLGLLLLVGAYFVLNIVNPQLLNLTLPNLTALSIPAGTGTGGGTGGTGGGTGGAPTGATGCAGGQCEQLPNCNQTTATTGAGAVNCSAAPAMVNELNCIQQHDPNFNVSEGYPPAVGHASGCHSNGCCVDTTVPAGNCAAVNALVQAASACGASQILDEYPACGGKTYNTTTGGNVHIAAPHTGGC